MFDTDIDKRKWLEREYKQSVGLLPISVRDRFMPEPVFSDDMDFMPLQAADLRAWYSHRSLGSDSRAMGALWENIEEIAHYRHEWTRENLANALVANERFGTKGLHRMFLAHVKKLEGKGVRLPSGKVII